MWMVAVGWGGPRETDCLSRSYRLSWGLLRSPSGLWYPGPWPHKAGGLPGVVSSTQGFQIGLLSFLFFFNLTNYDNQLCFGRVRGAWAGSWVSGPVGSERPGLCEELSGMKDVTA